MTEASLKGEAMNLPDLVQQYTANLDITTAGKHTVVLSLIERCFGGVPELSEIFDRDALAKFHHWLRTDPYAWRFERPMFRSPATVNQKLGVLFSWWEDAF